MTVSVAHHLEENAGKGFRLLQGQRVAAVDAHPQREAYAPGHPVPDDVVLGIGSSRDDSDAHGELAQAVPQRLLAALAEGSKLMRQAFGTVGTRALDHLVGTGLERDEQGVFQPALHESARADVHRLAGELAVEHSALGARVIVGYAGRRAHEDQAAQEVGKIERDPKAQTTTHRIADVDPGSAGLGDGAGRGVEVEGVGHVGCDDVDGFAPGARGEVTADLAPRGRRLAETVDQDQAHTPMFP